MEILITLLPVLVVILIGYFIKVLNLFDSNFISNIEKIVLNLMLPLSILLSFSTSTFTKDSLYLPAVLALTVVIMFNFAKIVMKPFKINAKFFPASAALFEGGLMGYSLFPILFAMPLSRIVSIDVGQGIMGFAFIYSILHASYHGKSADAISRIVDFIKSPIIISIILGILISISGILTSNYYLLQVFSNTCSFVASPCSVLILICLGYKLTFNFDILKEAFKLSVVRVIVNLFGLGFMLLIAHFILNVSRNDLFIIIFIFTLPPPFILTNYFNNASDHKLAASMTSISIIFTLLFFVLLKVIYG